MSWWCQTDIIRNRTYHLFRKKATLTCSNDLITLEENCVAKGMNLRVSCMNWDRSTQKTDFEALFRKQLQPNSEVICHGTLEWHISLHFYCTLINSLSTHYRKGKADDLAFSNKTREPTDFQLSSMTGSWPLRTNSTITITFHWTLNSSSNLISFIVLTKIFRQALKSSF